MAPYVYPPPVRRGPYSYDAQEWALEHWDLVVIMIWFLMGCYGCLSMLSYLETVDFINDWLLCCHTSLGSQFC